MTASGGTRRHHIKTPSQDLAGPKLPPRLYLDTVTLYTWQRLTQIDPILDRLLSASCQAMVEKAVVGEAEQLYEGPVAAALLQQSLKRIHVRDLAVEEPSIWGKVHKLRKWMTDDQQKNDPTYKPSKAANLGEAATIAYILTKDREAVFVTSDRAAESVAISAGVKVARTAAFLGLEIAFGALTVEQLWSSICASRRCSEDADQCQENFACPHLTDSAARAGVLGYVPDAASLTRMINGDLEKLAALDTQ